MNYDTASKGEGKFTAVSVGGGRGIKGIHILETPLSKQIASLDVEDGEIFR